MSIKKKLYEIALPSTELIPDPVFVRDSIRFEYHRDGVRFKSGISFIRMAAMRRRAERCSTAWHIEEAYDTLVQVEESSWADEIRRDTSPDKRDSQRYNHYLIYLDSVGAFEVIADSWLALPEEEGAWPAL